MLYIILLFSLMLISCGEVDDGQEYFLSEDEWELLQSYTWLKAYFYQPERIKEYSEYKGLTEIDSMYSSLNDTLKGWRYTRYYKPDTAGQVIDNIVHSEKYISFGFDKRYKIDTSFIGDEFVISYSLIVKDVYPFSPAADAGLKKHDTLLYANGFPLTGIADTNTVKSYLSSDSLFEDLTVFEVLRGTETKTLPAMQKKEVLAPTVYLDSLKILNGIPYITVTEFTRKTNNPEGTYYEFVEYLKEISGAKTAIIDLRYNPGGDIEHCTAMAAELVPLNRELVYDIEHYRSLYGENVIDTTHYFTDDFSKRQGAGTRTNWIILMSRYSASCSERFIVAVKHNRPETVLIGENTYGKGVGQVYGPTYLGGLAQITSLESFYPNGQPYHRIGVAPQIPLAINAPAADYFAKIEEVLGFNGNALAKRSFGPAQRDLPPVRKSKKTDLGMYHLLHQRE